MTGRIWSEKAVDYDGVMEIYDPLTGIVYFPNNISELSSDIKSRLCMRFPKGVFVTDLPASQKKIIEKVLNK